MSADSTKNNKMLPESTPSEKMEHLIGEHEYSSNY